MGIDKIIWKFKYRRLSLLSHYCYNNNITRLPYPPSEVFIEPTNHCNLKCIICPHGSGLKREKGFMSLDSFKKILKEVIKAKVLRATLNFAGEPLLNKNIFDMIRLAKVNNLYTRIHTNATLLPEDYSRRIIDSGLDELSFSFDDPRKEVYERIRVNASYEKTLANIKIFLEIKKGLKAKKPYTLIQRIKLSDSDDSDCVDTDYRKLFDGLGVNKFHTILTHNWAGSCQDSFIEKEDYDSTKSPCRAIWSRFAIGWDGKVYACCNEMNGKLLVGNLNTESLLDIWNGPQILNLRDKMLNGKYEEIEACRNCDVLLRTKSLQMNTSREYLAKLFLFLQRL